MKKPLQPIDMGTTLLDLSRREKYIMNDNE